MKISKCKIKYALSIQITLKENKIPKYILPTESINCFKFYLPPKKFL